MLVGVPSGYFKMAMGNANGQWENMVSASMNGWYSGEITRVLEGISYWWRIFLWNLLNFQCQLAEDHSELYLQPSCKQCFFEVSFHIFSPWLPSVSIAPRRHGMPRNATDLTLLGSLKKSLGPGGLPSSAGCCFLSKIPEMYGCYRYSVCKIIVDVWFLKSRK